MTREPPKLFNYDQKEGPHYDNCPLKPAEGDVVAYHGHRTVLDDTEESLTGDGLTGRVQEIRDGGKLLVVRYPTVPDRSDILPPGDLQFLARATNIPDLR